MKKSWKKLLASGLTASLVALALVGCGGGASGYDPEKPVGEQVNYQIQGIDPGAGIMELTHQAFDEYGLKDAGWQLDEASDAAMTATLEAAYKKGEPIIITGWTPHWIFQVYDLKYLDDPKGVYGEGDDIYTLVRKGLKEDDPTAYTFFERFYWEPSDMEQVMNDARETSMEEAAQKWVDENAAKVDPWVEGLEPQDGKTLRIPYVAWDSEMASTHVVKAALESKLGYQVELVQLDMGPMYASLAQGDTDAMTSAWLPTTSKYQYDKFKDDYETLSVNMHGTRLGLVVPTYMENINSIEDLVD